MGKNIKKLPFSDFYVVGRDIIKHAKNVAQCKFLNDRSILGTNAHVVAGPSSLSSACVLPRMRLLMARMKFRSRNRRTSSAFFTIVAR